MRKEDENYITITGENPYFTTTFHKAWLKETSKKFAEEVMRLSKEKKSRLFKNIKGEK